LAVPFEREYEHEHEKRVQMTIARDCSRTNNHARGVVPRSG
jgi:hypothetical protein